MNLETYFCFLTRNFYWHNVLRRNHSPRLLVFRPLLHASCGVLHIDAVQLVGHKACISPRQRIPYLIGLIQHGAIFVPGLIGKLILIVLYACLGYLQQLVHAKVLELEPIGKSRLQQYDYVEWNGQKAFISGSQNGRPYLKNFDDKYIMSPKASVNAKTVKFIRRKRGSMIIEQLPKSNV